MSSNDNPATLGSIEVAKQELLSAIEKLSLQISEGQAEPASHSDSHVPMAHVAATAAVASLPVTTTGAERAPESSATVATPLSKDVGSRIILTLV